MKRKLIIALAAAMTITLGSVGVVSADDTNFAPFIPVKETPIRDGFVWIVDTPAWTEEIKHPAETEDKWIVDKPAEYEQVWVVDMLGIAQTTYSQYELEKRPMPIDYLIALCKFYQVSADYMLGFSNKK